MRIKNRTSNTRDDWYDKIEGQVAGCIAVFEKVLRYAAIAGAILLVIVQTYKFVVSG